jgi:tetratricopeptide (TPR) repeat protein
VHGGPGGYRDQALGHFVQGTWLVQAGQVRQGELLCQQGLELDPFLHRHAREGLRRLGQRCDPRETGAIYFWLGVHSEALWDFKQAGEWYELAVAEFEEMGARVRESRARCSLGSIKLKLRDESGPQEFERAAALHPGNGAAHLNIGRLYYAAGQPGDAGYERALDEFACAMAADPQVYGPMVLASLRRAGDRWEQDLDKVRRRAEGKRAAHRASSVPITRPAGRRA